VSLLLERAREIERKERSEREETEEREKREKERDARARVHARTHRQRARAFIRNYTSITLFHISVVASFVCEGVEERRERRGGREREKREGE
jgi:hypothetical protein